MRGTSFEVTRAGPRRVRARRISYLALTLLACLAVIVSVAPQAIPAQAVQIHLDHWANGGSPQTAKVWRDGNLHWTNSHYAEGDADPARFIMDNLEPGTDYTLQFSWLATKKQSGPAKHAHDFLTNYTFSEYPSYTPLAGVGPVSADASYPDPCKPRVQGGGKPPNVCAPGSGPTSTWGIPADSLVGVKQTLGQLFALWNGDVTGVSVYGYSPSSNPFSGTSYNSLTVSFKTSASIPTGDGVVLAFGGHLARAADWGNGRGAADINGAPYHWSYVVVKKSTGERVADGNRDRSIMVVRKGSIEVQKVCRPDASDAGFLFGATQPSGVDGLPSSFSLDCNTSQGAIIDGGSGQYSITERPIAGYAVTSISCTKYAADGSPLGPPSGMSISPSLPVAYPNSVTLKFNFTAGDNVVCTFTNTKPDLTINLSPPDKTNEVGSPHVITATVQKNEGAGLVAASGAPVTFSLVNNTANATFVGANTCTTDGSGQCSVTINSSTPGPVDIHASTAVSIFGISLTRATGDGLPGDGSDVHKTYVDGYVTITPTAVNEVRHEHIFTINVYELPGDKTPAATANVNYSVSPAPSSSSTTCGSAVPFVSNVATCYLTINNGTAGVFTANATASFTIDGVPVTRSTDGTHGSSGSAIKTYVDANINLSPLTATNPVRSPHTITATAQQNDGASGWVPAVGQTVTFSLPSNPILASFVGGIDTCTTNSLGTCSVSINSVNPGTVTIHATTTFPVLGVSLTRATNDGLPGDGPDVNKIYVSKPAIAVTKRCVSPTSGSTITFYGTITNTGDTALKDISLVDNQPAPNTPVSLPQTTLAVGESTNYTGSYYTTTSPSTDTVTVSATEAFTGIVLVPASSEPQTCVLPQTRTLGFWATHTAFSNSLWVPQTLCTANNITATTAPGTNQLMGGFWSDVSKNADGSNRSNLSQARIQLLQQYFAAVLNYRYFHSGTQSQLDSARAAYCGKNVNAILTWVGILDKFNQSGDGLGDTSAAGNATSQESQTQANIPFWNEPSYR